MLFIASSTNLIVHDVVNNMDIFDRDVSDGIHCLAFGTIPDIDEPLVMAGGNCSITGFDLAAEDRFWTVTGDNCGAIEFTDWDQDGQKEMLVGTEDFSIRVFKGEEILQEMKETSPVLHLAQVSDHVFAFAL